MALMKRIQFQKMMKTVPARLGARAAWSSADSRIAHLEIFPKLCALRNNEYI